MTESVALLRMSCNSYCERIAIKVVVPSLARRWCTHGLARLDLKPPRANHPVRQRHILKRYIEPAPSRTDPIKIGPKVLDRSNHFAIRKGTQNLARGQNGLKFAQALILGWQGRIGGDCAEDANRC